VRERVPIAPNDAEAVSSAQPPQPSAPTSQPVITEVGESEQTDKPRRSGWWSRRFAGG